MNLPEEDQAVLQQLADHGDDPRVERPVIHWFFGEEADLREIGKQLSSMGWTNTDPRQDEDGWLMSPTKSTDLGVDAILSMNEEIVAASSDLDVTYDGWETSVERSN